VLADLKTSKNTLARIYVANYMKAVNGNLAFSMVRVQPMGSTTTVSIPESAAMYPPPEFSKTRMCRFPRRSTITLLALCALAATTHILAADVRVFTDRLHPIDAPSDVRVVELDAAARIESALAADLPSDPTQAAAIVRQRLKDGSDTLQHRLPDAYQDVTDAWSLGVTKIPAVVVDRRYVVYGETDVARALARIEAYRRTEP
jgi:integrating conjugative element protein (TIGR03757 family)